MNVSQSFAYQSVVKLWILASSVGKKWNPVGKKKLFYLEWTSYGHTSG